LVAGRESIPQPLVDLVREFEVARRTEEERLAEKERQAIALKISEREVQR